MKKIRLILALLLMIVAAAALSACDNIKYDVDFIVDGEVHATIKTRGGEVLSMPSEPTKDGFIFNGWYRDENSRQNLFTQNSLLVEVLRKDIRVHAQFDPAGTPQHTQAKFAGFTAVNADTYSMSVSNATEALNFGSVVEVNSKSSWVLASDMLGQFTIPSKVAPLTEGDNTFYIFVTAKSEVKLYTLQIRRNPMYTVIFDTEGGTPTASQRVEEGFCAAKPATEPERTGYKFASWDFDFAAPVTDETVIKAIWDAETYKINYHANNGTDSKKIQDAVFNSSIILQGSNAFTKNGFTLTKWSTKSDGSGTDYALNFYIADYNTAADLDLHAVWSRDNYSITYHTDGGENDTRNPNGFHVESSTMILFDASKEHYTFDGWFTEGSFANKVEQITTGSFGNLDLYAKFTAIPYAITYHLDGSENDNNPDSYTVEDAIVFANPDKQGHIFDGWFTDSGFVNKITEIPKGSTGEIELYAKFTRSEYKAVYHSNYSVISQFTVYIVFETAYTLKDGSAFVRAGYSITKWNTQADGNGTNYPLGYLFERYDREKNFELFAVWKINDYKINYYLDSGTNGSNPDTYTVEEAVALENAGKTGYTFDGWFTDSGFERKITAIQKGSMGDIDLYAKFTAIGYKVIYSSNCLPETESTDYIVFDSELTLKGISAFSRRGYELIGWNTQADGQGTGYALGYLFEQYKFSENLQLYAVWDVINYEIVYHLDGGTNGANPETYTVEDELTLADAHKADYTFDGWFTESTFKNRISNIQKDNVGKINLYAKFTPVPYSIIYHLDGGSNNPANPAIYTDKMLPLVLESAAKAGFGFDGWYAESAFENKIERIENCSGNINLYALWKGSEANPYIIATKDELISFAASVNAGTKYSGAYFVLSANIDLNGAGWQPIGLSSELYFAGNFNGREFVVSNFAVNGYKEFAGLFGYNQGDISNLGVKNFTIDIYSATCYAGGLIGLNNGGTISNCFAIGDIVAAGSSGYAYAGGLIGYNIDGTVTGCHAGGQAEAKLTAPALYSYAGGLIGNNSGALTDCYATGTASASARSFTYAGGLVGDNSGVIIRCHATGLAVTASEGG